MGCQTCSSLLASYRLAVSLYSTSVAQIKTLPHPKTESLRQTYRYRRKASIAWDALMAHHEDHEGFAARGNGFGLVSQEAEQLRRSRRDADDALIAQEISSG